jgi:hypothetical protein
MRRIVGLWKMRIADHDGVPCRISTPSRLRFDNACTAGKIFSSMQEHVSQVVLCGLIRAHDPRREPSLTSSNRSTK